MSCDGKIDHQLASYIHMGVLSCSKDFRALGFKFPGAMANQKAAGNMGD